MTKKVLLQHCNESDVNAVRSLLGLLAAYLREPWIVVLEGAHDLALVRLADGETRVPIPATGAPTPIPCVQHPRRYAGHAINHPFRAADLLTVLNEHSERARTSAATPAANARVASDAALELLHWPADFVRWPAPFRRMAAALTCAARPASALAAATGCTARQVQAFARAGIDAGFVVARSLADGEVVTRVEPSGVAGLYSRVRARMGLA